ncbi:MAG: TonB-dependent receptor [Bacteroidales bacterium]|nr:TonB-dependent receptor [Bacteroidales bacterium]
MNKSALSIAVLLGSFFSLYSPLGASNGNDAASAEALAPNSAPTEDVYDLEEVVITGQGAEIKKRRLSSNVQTLSGKQLETLPTTRIDQLLQTALPNMKVNLSSGQPGATSLMWARGLSSAYSNSTPVIYVDGVRVDNNNTASALTNDLNGGNHTGSGFLGQTSATSSIADIPLENIERIEFVPGGAATTLYGSDAANGVIQIFTKKGNTEKFRATVGAEIGSEVATSDYYYFSRTKDLLHQTGLYQKYRLNMESGSERGGWSLGASMSHSDGTIVANAQEQKRYDLRLGTHYSINQKVEYQSSWGAAFHNQRYARNGNEGLYSGLWSIECADFGYADNESGLKTLYPLREKDASGNWVKIFNTCNVDELSSAELARLKQICYDGEDLSSHTDEIRRFQTSQSLTYKPFAGFIAKATLGLDFRHNQNRYSITNAWLDATGERAYLTLSSMRNFERSYLGLTFDASASYNYTNEWLSSVTTTGYQFFSTDDHQTTTLGKDLRDGQQTISGAATKTADEWTSYLNNYGWYLQENIGILNRYYLDLGVRGDYNSAFGDNVGWQWYPKVGVSYLLTEESFARDLSWMNQFRLFANYGVAGLYPPAFAYQRTVALTSFLGEQAATFDQYGNPDLGPEKKHSFEAGFSSSWLNNRISLGANYYYALTRDALFSVPLPPSVGEGSSLQNAGKIENKGIEFSLGLHVVQTREWDVLLQGSLNTNSNKVLSSGGATTFAIGGFGASSIQSVVTEGESVGYLRGSCATMQADGTVLIEKLQNLGNTLPDCFGTLSLQVRWKQLNFYANGDWQTGAHVHSYDAQFRFRNGLKIDNVPDEMLIALGMNPDGSNRWKIQKSNWTNLTNYFVYRSDFLKVRQIGLDYTFRKPVQWIEQLKLGFSVSNPFTITDCPCDPEATVSSTQTQGAVATGGFNYATYSAPRQYLGSISISF